MPLSESSQVCVRSVNGAGERCGCGKPSKLRLHYGPLSLGVIDSDIFLCTTCTAEALEHYIAGTEDRKRFGEAATEEYR